MACTKRKMDCGILFFLRTFTLVKNNLIDQLKSNSLLQEERQLLHYVYEMPNAFVGKFHKLKGTLKLLTFSFLQLAVYREYSTQM